MNGIRIHNFVAVHGSVQGRGNILDYCEFINYYPADFRKRQRGEFNNLTGKMNKENGQRETWKPVVAEKAKIMIQI